MVYLEKVGILGVHGSIEMGWHGQFGVHDLEEGCLKYLGHSKQGSSQEV